MEQSSTFDTRHDQSYLNKPRLSERKEINPTLPATAQSVIKVAIIEDLRAIREYLHFSAQ